MSGDDWKLVSDLPQPKHGDEYLFCTVYKNRATKFAVSFFLEGKEMVYADPDFVDGWYISDGHNEPIWHRAHYMATHFCKINPPLCANRILFKDAQ